MMRSMRTRIETVLISTELGEFGDEVRRIFVELGRTGDPQLSGECSPPVDVFETDDTLEIAVDLPAVDADAIRILARGLSLLIAGQKTPRRGQGSASFHLVERGFGRFARLVRLTTPCDPARARATLSRGELRISVPKIAERRGRPFTIAVTPGP
jgi:HSP20 family protein